MESGSPYPRSESWMRPVPWAMASRSASVGVTSRLTVVAAIGRLSTLVWLIVPTASTRMFDMNVFATSFCVFESRVTMRTSTRLFGWTIPFRPETSSMRSETARLPGLILT